MIGEHPPEISNRSGFGRWEGDLMIFGLAYGKANLTSLVKRRSRFTILARNPSRHSARIMAGIQHHLHILPPFPASVRLPFEVRIAVVA
jgi:IS30 family transposase